MKKQIGVIEIMMMMDEIAPFKWIQDAIIYDRQNNKTHFIERLLIDDEQRLVVVMGEQER